MVTFRQLPVSKRLLCICVDLDRVGSGRVPSVNSNRCVNECKSWLNTNKDYSKWTEPSKLCSSSVGYESVHD